MNTAYADPFDALFNLQRERLKPAPVASGFKPDCRPGPIPTLNVFQQGDEILAIVELPGLEKSELQIQAKENTIRIFGKKVVNYPEGSVHRRERVFGDFDRTISLPVQLDPDGIKAEYRDGLLALFLPRSEREKPRTIKVS
jgi:HSP20 family protein